MNSNTCKSLKATAVFWTVIGFGVIVSACGGGESSQSAGIGGTGISVGKGVVQGRVTGFGSIYVNGSRFNIDSSDFIVDGSNFVGRAGQDELALGMVVRVGVETIDGVFTDKALDVVYDDEVQGPVAVLLPLVPGETQRTFNVFGQVITIDDTSTLFKGAPANSGFGFDSIRNNDVVEISGFRTSANAISATYVEWKEVLVDGSEVELRGIVRFYEPPPIQEFMLDGVLITFDVDTDIEVGGAGLMNDVYVEVKGEYRTASPSVHATEIEEEDQGLGDDVDEVSLQGLIYDYVSISDFKINGQRIDAGQASLSPANAQALLANGVNVEVQGSIVGGVLMVDELELNEVETALKAFVFVDAANNRFEVDYAPLVGSIVIETNAETEFKDNGPLPVVGFSVADISFGDFVAVEGVESAGKVIAGSIERLDPGDSELQGQVDSFSAVMTTLTVLGIPFRVNDDTEYKDSSGGISATKFFGKLANGDRVEITDKDYDGIAEEVKLDD